ncbi:MAG: ATP-binding protein [Actinomycetota bacterium]
MDTPVDPALERITRLAAAIFKVPIALVSLVDDDRQWFKSCVGVDDDQTSRNVSFCAHAILSDEVMVVPDALADPRFADNPLVTGGPGIRFYAGAPLKTSDGFNLGTVCVVDTQPRELNGKEIAALSQLAAVAMDLLELRLAQAQMLAEAEERERAEEELRRKSGLVRLLRAVAVAANQARTLDEGLRVAVAEVCGFTGWPVGHAFLPSDTDTGELVSTDIWHLHEPERFERFRHETEASRFRPGSGFAATVYLSARSIWVADVSKDGEFARSKAAEQVGLKGALAFPILMREEVAGVLEFFSEREAEPDEPLLDVMAHVGTQLGRVAERERSEKERDALIAQQSDLAQQLRLLLESTPGGIYGIDVEGRCTFINRAAADMLGYPPEDVLGEQMHELIHHSHPDGSPYAVEDCPIYRAFRDGSGCCIENEVLFRRDGSSFSAEYSADPIVEQDVICGAVATLVDITERKQAEAALKAARDEAERADRAKSEFLSRMSHELRTPMNAILGFAQLLELDDLTPEQLDAVGHILKAGNHLLGLINEVLDIARIEAGRMSLSIEPVEVAEVVNEVIDLIRPMSTERDIRVSTELGQVQDVHVLADRQRFKQVLLNLVSNAVKYNRASGTVLVFFEDVGEGQLSIKVHDTGWGIAPERTEDLFKPFERLGVHGTGVEGSGLGLAISKRLAEVMGGEVGVDSVVGEGSTFWVQLPLGKGAPQPAEDSDEARLEEPALQQSGTVLYIEDNLSNLNLMQRILARHPQVKLISAMQGSLGVELARKHCPDLILLDLHLPDMDGSDVLKQLREMRDVNDPEIVILSADATPSQIDRLLQAGADDYLTKPFDLRRFMEVLDRSLGAEIGFR